MSYATQAALAADAAFQQRIRAATTQQANTFKDDARPEFVALAESVLRVEATAMPTFFQMEAAAPGFADDADQGDGTIDSSLITDAQLLATTQAVWPTVAALFFDDTGAPIS
jgi:hypothetical protein